jgi:hypothetical protein
MGPCWRHAAMHRPGMTLRATVLCTVAMLSVPVSWVTMKGVSQAMVPPRMAHFLAMLLVRHTLVGARQLSCVLTEC